MIIRKIITVILFFIIGFSCSDNDKDTAPVKVSTCSHKVYSGADNCDAGYVTVPGGCCPSTNPWYCKGKCYLYCADAGKNCPGGGVVKGKL